MAQTSKICFVWFLNNIQSTCFYQHGLTHCLLAGIGFRVKVKLGCLKSFMKGTIWKVITFFLKKSKMTQCCLHSSFRIGNWNEGRRRSRQKFIFPFSRFFFENSREARHFPVQTSVWIEELPKFSHLCYFAFCDVWAGCTQLEVVCEAGGGVCRQVKHLPQQGHLLEQLQSAETSCDLLPRTCSRCTTVGGCVHLFARCSLVYRPQLHLRHQDTRKLRISTLKLTHFCVKVNRWNPNIGMCICFAFKDFVFLISAW